MVADAHCHFFSRGFFETLGRQRGDSPIDVVSMAASLGIEPPGDPEELADRWVAELDRHEVARAALIASVPGDEASVVAAVQRHPTRLVGFFLVDPTAVDALERVDLALDQGLRTVCLFPAMHRYPLHGEAVSRVAALLAQRRGTALFVHCGVLSVGIRHRLGLPSVFESRFANPLDLQAVALGFPALPIILPHFGAGFFREALMLADLCPNVHLDTSSSNGWLRYYPGLALEDVFARALDVAGPARLLFGTDSSFFPRGWQQAIHDRQREVVKRLHVGQDETDLIFGGNFDRLFPQV